MTMVDVLSQISQIQSTLSQLATGRLQAAAAPTAASSTAGSTAPSSTAFAQAFAAASGTGTAAASGTAVGSPVAAAGTATGQDVVNDAKKYLGVPYVWGGTNPATGLDCSGLVQRVYKDLGIDLPRVASDQMNAGTAVPSLAQAKPGDLLVMHGAQHIGIYLGSNQYIHAPMPGQNVQIADIPAGARFDRIVRVIPDPPAAAAPAVQPAAPAGPAAMTDLLSSLQASLITGQAA
jgi:cell wall-associated NlpC family hydrolase